MQIAIWWEQHALGGVDTQLLALLKHWPDKVDKFVIFTNQSNPGAQRIFTELNAIGSVSFRDFHRGPIGSYGVFKKFVLRLLFPLRFIFLILHAWWLLSRGGKFDVLLSNNGGYPGALSNLAVLGAGAVLRYRIRLLLVHHAADHPSALRFGFESLLDLCVQKWATGIISVSLATRESLRNIRGFSMERCPMHIIHNGIENVSSPPRNLSSLRQKLSIFENSFVIGMVGRIERYKGHEDLIMAIGDLPEEHRSKCKAILVGAGNPMEIHRLKKLADGLGLSSQVYFPGFISENVQTFMGEFNVLAMLTKDFEGFGLTVAEAICAGIPVVATNVGAVPEVIHSGIAWMVPPDSPEAVRDALLNIIQSPDEAREKVGKAKKHIEKFGAKAMAKKYHSLIKLRQGAQ